LGRGLRDHKGHHIVKGKKGVYTRGEKREGMSRIGLFLVLVFYKDVSSLLSPPYSLLCLRSLLLQVAQQLLKVILVGIVIFPSGEVANVSQVLPISVRSASQHHPLG
jgi:hypothetical protein